MGAIARRVRSTPFRTASETWTTIIGLVAVSESGAAQELERVRGVCASVIASEAPGNAPIIVSGVGDQVRIYCLFGDEAVVGDNASESPLAWDPTNGDWAMSLPCDADDLEWIRETLSKGSLHVTARDSKEASLGTTSNGSSADRVTGAVDREAFFRP